MVLAAAERRSKPRYTLVLAVLAAAVKVDGQVQPEQIATLQAVATAAAATSIRTPEQAHLSAVLEQTEL